MAGIREDGLATDLPQECFGFAGGLGFPIGFFTAPSVEAVLAALTRDLASSCSKLVMTQNLRLRSVNRTATTAGELRSGHRATILAGGELTVTTVMRPSDPWAGVG